MLAVGDAAGLVKPTTGGGIYYGLLSGQIAADVLAEALSRRRLGARRLKEYERRWRARLGPEIRAGLAFRAVAARLNDRAIDRWSSSPASTASSRCSSRPRTSTGTAPPPSRCCATPSSAASSSVDVELNSSLSAVRGSMERPGLLS